MIFLPAGAACLYRRLSLASYGADQTTDRRMSRKLPFGILLFVGLTLLGWGLSDAWAFFQNPVRAAYVLSVALLSLAIALWFPEAMTSGGLGTRTVNQQKLTIWWLQAVSLALTVGGPYCDHLGLAVLSSPVFRYVGLVLAVGGFVLMLWARVALGRQFSLHVTLQPGHRLVTEGLYRHLRHPRYTGILFFLVGTALVYRSWLGLLLAAVSLVVLLWRIHDEETLLRREFGAQWAAYAQKTPRLLPYLY